MAGLLAAILGGPTGRRNAIDLSAWQDIFLGWKSKAGISITVDRALQCTTALACTQAIASGVAMLPLKLKRRLPNGGAEDATSEPLFELLNTAPNEWQTAVEFIETLLIHAVLTGNGFAVINRVRGQVRELIPVLPANVRIEQESNYRLIYQVCRKDGSSATVPSTNMLHLRGPAWESYFGMDCVRLAREAIGLALATEESHARLHSNGVRPGGILSTDGKLGEDAIKLIKQSWNEVQGGVENAMKTAVLQGGLKWTPLAMTGVDGQHIETRKHQIEEICRAFGVWPQMVGHGGTQSPTYASAEQFFLAHVVHTLSRWTVRLEKRLKVDLIPKEQWSDLNFKFSLQALLRGDNKTRAEFYKALVMLGVMTRNEARALEEMNPIEGLDVPLEPTSNASVPGQGEEPGDDPDAQAEAALRRAAAAIGRPLNVGRVLSAENERRIRDARDNLDTVLAKLDAQKEE